MRRRHLEGSLVRFLSLVLTLTLGVVSPLAALETPSKSATEQSLAEREADLAVVVDALKDEAVVAAIEAHGFSIDQAHARLAQLSPDELHHLAGQVDQLQAAGLQPPRYIWILLAVLISVVILATIF